MNVISRAVHIVDRITLWKNSTGVMSVVWISFALVAGDVL